MLPRLEPPPPATGSLVAQNQKVLSPSAAFLDQCPQRTILYFIAESNELPGYTPAAQKTPKLAGHWWVLRIYVIDQSTGKLYQLHVPELGRYCTTRGLYLVSGESPNEAAGHLKDEIGRRLRGNRGWFLHQVL